MKSFSPELQKIKDAVYKIRIHFNPGKGNYWDSITKCGIKSKPAKLSGYYMDFTSKASYPGEFDSLDIPLFKDPITGKNFYQPVVIAQYALGLYSIYEKEHSDKVRSEFIKCADWFIKNLTEINGLSGWPLYRVSEEYKLNPPWFSALAQGEAISVLSRAYILTNEKKYLDTAEKALQLFKVDQKDGGILNYFLGNPVYEEYPSTKPNGAFTGFVFSLFGLYDLKLLGNSLANELFLKGAESFAILLPYYDTGSWSRYSLYSYPEVYLASAKYHTLHIEQLKVLYKLTGNIDFKDYAEKWQKFADSLINKSLVLVNKIKNGNY